MPGAASASSPYPVLSAPTCSSVDTSRTWSTLASASGSERTSATSRLHAVDLALGEIDADEVDPGPQKGPEVRGLGERVADLEHPAGRDEAREDPRDLDHALVRSRRRLEPREAHAPAAGTETERDGVVQLADARRLVGRDELVDEGRARQRPVSQLGERPGARIVVGRPPQHLVEGAFDERLVRVFVGLQRGADERIHA